MVDCGNFGSQNGPEPGMELKRWPEWVKDANFLATSRPWWVWAKIVWRGLDGGVWE
jgi:hypothetical protein